MTIITYRDLIDRTYDDVKDFCSYSYQEVETFVHDTLQLVCKMHEMAYISDKWNYNEEIPYDIAQIVNDTIVTILRH